MKIKLIISVLSILFAFSIQAQVGIGTETPNASSLLELSSTSKGLLVPRMTENQKNAISSPAQGLLIFQTNGTIGFYSYDGSNWLHLIHGSSQGLYFGPGTGNGDNNLAVGTSLGSGTGKRNTAIGSRALESYSGTSFDNNTAVGYYALQKVTTGQQNTGLGAEVMFELTSGSHNTAIGAQTIINSTGSGNTALGYRAGETLTTGSNNTLIGKNANVSSNNLSNAIAIGHNAIVDASNKIRLGDTNVTLVETSGTVSASAFVGDGSGLTGISSGATNLNGLSDAVVSNQETIIIGSTPNVGTTATYSTGVGKRVLESITEGDENVAMGHQALGSTTTGSYNTAMGSHVNFRNTTGNYNSSFGVRVLENTTTGSSNTGIGSSAGDTNTTGSNNTFIGRGSDANANNLTNATAIGANATVNAPNKIRLGDTNVTNIETSGTITAGAITIPNTDGTANQVLKTNGSGSLSWTTIGGPVYGSSVVTTGSSSAATDSQIDLPGLSFRYNGGRLEIKYESGNNPQAIALFFSHSNETSRWSSNVESNIIGSVYPSTSAWTAMDNSYIPLITGYYKVYEYDFTVYPLNSSGRHYGRTYNVKIFLDGWGGVHMRAFYQ